MKDKIIYTILFKLKMLYQPIHTFWCSRYSERKNVHSVQFQLQCVPPYSFSELFFFKRFSCCEIPVTTIRDYYIFVPPPRWNLDQNTWERKLLNIPGRSLFRHHQIEEKYSCRLENKTLAAYRPQAEAPS